VENGCGTTSVTFNEPGCFDISLFLDNNGCTNQLTIEDMICVYPYPIAEFSPSTSTISELDAVVNFTNESTNATSYFWDFGDGSSSVASNPSNDYAASAPGEITVMLIASSSAGCTDTAYANLQMIEELIFYVPNTFTPDADNYNPEFKPIFYSGTNPLEYSLTIYNRWGQLLFESKNRDFGWNGSYGQNSEVEMCQDGVYTWKISYSHNGKSKVAVGHVNLLR
jgi:gliding motility-associated-like protein